MPSPLGSRRGRRRGAGPPRTAGRGSHRGGRTARRRRPVRWRRRRGRVRPRGRAMVSPGGRRRREGPRRRARSLCSRGRTRRGAATVGQSCAAASCMSTVVRALHPGVMAPGLHEIAALGHGAPACGVGAAAVQEEPRAIGIGTRPQASGGCTMEVAPGHDGFHGETLVAAHDQTPFHTVFSDMWLFPYPCHTFSECRRGRSPANDFAQEVSRMTDSVQLTQGTCSSAFS